MVSHSMHTRAEDYLPFIRYFVQNHYSVFSCDCKGAYASEGDSTVGMVTPQNEPMSIINKEKNYVL